MSAHRCTGCRVEKDASEFFADRRRRSGLKTRCKSCCRTAAKEAGWDASWKIRNPGRKAEVNRSYRERHPGQGCGGHEHFQAHGAVDRAVRSGRLVRPTACERCGVACHPHGHHPDYSKPLEVVWVCQPCHAKEHADAMR